MPTYDYRCPANGEVLEARHRLSEAVRTWGELCALTGRDPGTTPPGSPVEKLATGGQVVRAGSLGNASPPCGGGACGSGACGWNG